MECSCRYSSFGYASESGSSDDFSGAHGNDHRRCIGVARDQARDDRGIDDADALDPTYLQLGIENRIAVRAHPAGAGNMKSGLAETAERGEDFLIALHLRSRRQLLNDE